MDNLGPSVDDEEIDALRNRVDELETLAFRCRNILRQVRIVQGSPQEIEFRQLFEEYGWQATLVDDMGVKLEWPPYATVEPMKGLT